MTIINARRAVNRSHPLARALFNCIIFDGLLPIDLVIGIPPYQQTAPQIVTYDGVGRYTNHYSTAKLFYNDLRNIAAGDMTAWIRFIPKSFPHDFSAVFFKGTECSLFLDTSGNLSYHMLGGTVGSVSGTTGFAVNKIANLAMTRVGSAVNFWADGASIGSTTNSGTSSGLAGDLNVIEIGSRANQVGAQDSDFYALAFMTWSRALSQMELISLQYDVQQFIRPRPLVFTVPASVPPPPLTLMGQIWM